MKKTVTRDALQEEIKKSIPLLLETARDLTWNSFSDNHTFILTEILNTDENFHEQRRTRTLANNQKRPVPLTEIMPRLENLYEDLYDINLHIYNATSAETIFDIQYYLKSSLDQDFRAIVKSNPPMFHCKINMPYSQDENKEKFDINWEHREQ